MLQVHMSILRRRGVRCISREGNNADAKDGLHLLGRVLHFEMLITRLVAERKIGTKYPDLTTNTVRNFSMRRMLFAAVALGGLTALTTLDASAAPSSAAGVHVAPSRPLVTNVDYDWHHRHYHHRHWDHDHWRYW
jgi:hypothetical protein